MNPAFFRPLKIITTAVFFLSAIHFATAQAVDRAELEKIQSAGIVFINYEGPHARVEGTGEIKGLGTELGRAIKSGSARAGGSGKYFVIHCKGTGSDKLDADVFGLGVDSGVDHIRNLRLILQGYLESAYAYSEKDAALLAEYVTIYNAVYRGNWDYFNGRYKDVVIKELTADKAGLSIRFDEWPGRSLIVIPLSVGKPGSLSAVSTTPLTDKKVVDELRKSDDKGVDTRKGMVDLKEREAKEATQTAQIEREAIKDEEARLAAEKKALEDKKAQQAADEKKAAEAKAKAAEAQKTADATKSPADAEAATKAAEEQKKADQKVAEDSKAVAAQEGNVAKQESKLDERKATAQEAQKRADQKTEEARTERTDIAKDQQAVIKEQDAKAAATLPSGTTGLMMLNQTSDLARLVLIDIKTGTELKRSAIDTLHARTVVILEDRIIAIAGTATGSGAVRLVTLDKKSLEMSKQGGDDIASNSLLWINGADVYALTVSGGKTWLSRFNKDLVKQASSSVDVHPWCSPVFNGDTVAAQTTDGSAVYLGSSDLVKK